jgi:hypothetical protein
MARKSGSGTSKSATASRENRLKAALKANLAKRKAQTRARSGADKNNGTQDAGQDKDN